MELIFVRHGQTYENKNRIVQGQMEGRLTELGKKQAEKTGEWLSEKSITKVYCSDLKRAKHTAKIVLSFHPKLYSQIIFSKLIREKYLGILQGKSYEFAEKMRNVKLDVETNEQVLERAKRFLKNEIFTLLPSKETILIVSHGGWIKQAVFYLLSLSQLTIPEEKPRINNASISIFYINGTSSRLRITPDRINFLGHLEDL